MLALAVIEIFSKIYLNLKNLPLCFVPKSCDFVRIFPDITLQFKLTKIVVSFQKTKRSQYKIASYIITLLYYSIYLKPRRNHNNRRKHSDNKKNNEFNFNYYLVDRGITFVKRNFREIICLLLFSELNGLRRASTKITQLSRLFFHQIIQCFCMKFENLFIGIRYIKSS